MARSKCESCGMPLKPAVMGTDADGTKSTQYCVHCYEGGAFTAPNASVDEMRQLSIKGMTDSRWPRFLATFLTKNMQNLPRWQKADTTVP